MTAELLTRAGRRRKASAGLVAAVLLAGMVGASALGFVGYTLWPRWPVALADIHSPPLPITVGGVLLNVPPAAIRVPLQRHAGEQPRLDLAYLWPALTPPEPEWKPVLSAVPKAPDQIFLSFAGSEGTLPLEDRVKTIYPRYTEPGAFAGPEGLTGIAFRDNTPYRGEDLFFPSDRPERFFVRCTRTVGPTAGSCILERHVEHAELTARFPRDWLADWPKLAEGLDRLIVSLRQGAG